MKIRKSRRFQAGLLTVALASGVLFGGAVASANAVPAAASVASGTLSFSPTSGNDQTRMSVTTSGPCTAGTNLIVRVYGYGFPTLGQNVVGNTAVSTFTETASGGRVVPLEDTMRSFAAQQATPFLLKGKYTFALRCIQPLQWETPLDLFSGAINFTSAGAYIALPASAAAIPKGANSPPPAAVYTPKPSSSATAKAAVSPAATPTKSTTPTPTSDPTASSSAAAVPAGSSGAQAAAAAPVSSTSLSGGGSMAWVLLLALVAIAAIAGGVFWYFRREPATASPSAHRSRK